VYRVFVPETKDEEPGYYGGFFAGHLSIGERSDATIYRDAEPALETARILCALLNVEAHVEEIG
jgi:hypothetical protein